MGRSTKWLLTPMAIAACLTLSGCGTTTVFDELPPADASDLPPNYGFPAESVRVLGESEGVLYLAVRPPEEPRSNCLVMIPDGDTDSSAIGCTTSSVLRVSGGSTGSAILHVSGAEEDEMEGEQVSQWLEIVNPPGK